MDASTKLEVSAGIGWFRPQGHCNFIDAVDFIAHAIGYCRDRNINKLLVDTTGLIGVAIPTMVDRFLAVEEWATIADGMVVVALVADAKYIDPNRFGIKVATHFGLTANVFVAEADAHAWLVSTEAPT